MKEMQFQYRNTVSELHFQYEKTHRCDTVLYQNDVSLPHRTIRFRTIFAAEHIMQICEVKFFDWLALCIKSEIVSFTAAVFYQSGETVAF